jgi:NitT/TauT family transport system substrate-binding protein
MKKTLAWLIVLATLLTSCTSSPKTTDEKPLVLSTDVWIGASLIYYAHSMGWLREANIELLQAQSIGENMQLFESGASDIFTGTQHEYQRERKLRPDLVPVLVYDRSYGGDVVMSNRSLEQLRNSSGPIKVYLEADSVSEEILAYLIRFEGLPEERIVVHNRTQEEMERINGSGRIPPTIIVTYNPHDLALVKKGFVQIASSKDNRYLVIDAVYAPSRIVRNHKQQLQMLDQILKRSEQAYLQDSKEFYEKVKPYLGNPSYDEFLSMRKNILWGRDMSTGKLQNELQKIDFPTEGLL